MRFLDEDGLCALQKRYGETYLSAVCALYPRVTYRFRGFTERSLALTCPVAARRVLLSSAPMRLEERLLPVRLDALARRLAREEAAVEASLYETHARLFERLAVNELFLRLAPFAMAAGLSDGFKLFALRFRAVEFALLAASSAKGAPLDTEEILRMIDRMMERLDHNRRADETLRRYTIEALGGMTCGEALA